MKASEPYLLAEKFPGESQGCGGVWFGEAARGVGYRDTHLAQDWPSFVKQVHPRTGQPLLRKQANNQTSLDCYLNTFHPSLNILYALAPPEIQARIEERAHVLTHEGVKLYMEPWVFLRTGAAGYTLKEARPLFATVIHCQSNCGEVCFHVNTVFQRAGVSLTDPNRIRSINDQILYRAQRHMREHFQLEMADFFEQDLKLRVQYDRGTAVAPDVPKELIEKFTGASQRRIDHYIAANNLPDTPAARALAAKKCRVERQPVPTPEFKEQLRAEIQKVAPDLFQQAILPAQIGGDANQRLNRAFAETEIPAVKQRAAEHLATLRKALEARHKSRQEAQRLARPEPMKPKPEPPRPQKEEVAQPRKDTGPKEDIDQTTVRQQRPAYTTSQKVQEGNQELKQARRMARLGAEVKAIARVYGAALMKALRPDRQIVRVNDVEKFLKDTRKPSRLQAHRAAYAHLTRHQARDLKHALEIAEQGYKLGRIPKLVVAKGSIVVISPKTKLSEVQRRELDALARRCKLKIQHTPKPELPPQPRQTPSQ